MLLLAVAPAFSATYLVTIAGLGGEPDYEQRFALLATDTDKMLRAGGAGDRVIDTLKGADATKAKVEATLTRIAGQAKAGDVFMLMLIGHGTYDGVQYKFNLPGPDISGAELAALLNKIPATRQLVVNMTSASGGATGALKKDGRTVITATKSGTEKNAVVFARYWVEALRDPSADTDKNEAISAAEAFLYAQAKTKKFYDDNKRLSTEHAVLEDPQRAGNYTLLRYGTAAAQVKDPAKKELVSRKEQIENQIDSLKFQKATMDAAQYRAQLTALLLQLAQVQEALDK